MRPYRAAATRVQHKCNTNTSADCGKRIKYLYMYTSGFLGGLGMASMHLRLLGRPILDGPTISIPLQPTKPHALGCYLAAQAGRMIPRPRIIATFWEDLHEADGRRALTTTLGRLRQTLPLWPIRSQGDLLGWDLSAGIGVDLTEIVRLDPARVGELWRGPFLEDFELKDAPTFDQWVQEQRQYWEEQALRALHHLVVAESAQGAWASVAAHARQALRINPLQEQFHRALMEALCRAGDRAAALAQYDAVTQRLHIDLGVEPDVQTKELRDAIRSNNLAHDVAAASQPRVTLGSSQSQPHHLPAPATRFVGRQADIAKVKAKFSATRLVSLTGTGGVGKSRLALQAATDLLAARTDGVWWVELAELTKPEQVPAAVALAFGLQEQPDRLPLHALVAHLRSRHVLLVLDNCEHLIEACAALADTLLQACPQVWILATSREPLGIAGEVVWSVPPLGSADAITLFSERAAASLPGFTPTTRDTATIARICRGVDGIALGIELVAGLVTVLTVGEIDARLRDRFALLNLGRRAAQDRQKTLRHAIDWSYDLLSDAERTLLRRLAVFAGGFTLEAAESVCAGPDLLVDQVLARLRQLVDKSLVVAEKDGDGRRFRLLEAIRQYGLERLQEAAEVQATCARHSAWYTRSAFEAAAKQFSRERMISYAWFDRELDNLRAALDWGCVVPGALAGTVGLTWALVHYWDGRGILREGREWAARLSALTQEYGDPALQASVATLSAYLALMHGDFAAATAPAERGLLLWHTLGNQQGIARCRMCMGLVALHAGDPKQAVKYLEEAVTLGRAENAESDLGFFLYFLAEAVAAQGDIERARGLHEEVVTRRRADGSVMLATPLMRLARLAWLEGDHVRAAALERESLSLYDPSFKLGVALVLDEVCIMAAGRGHMERAACAGGAADAIRRSLEGREDAQDRITPNPTIISTGITVQRGLRADVAAALAEARSRLGEQPFLQAWHLGQSFGPEEALAYAQSEFTSYGRLPRRRGQAVPG